MSLTSTSSSTKKTKDKIEVMSFHGDKCSGTEFINPNERVVGVLYTRGVISSGRNHYDTIWHIKKGQNHKRRTQHIEFEPVESENITAEENMKTQDIPVENIQNEHIFQQPKTKCSRLSLNRGRHQSLTSQQPTLFIDLMGSDDDDNRSGEWDIEIPPSPHDCIMLSHVKEEPIYLRNERNDKLFFNRNDDIVTHSEHSDSTYLTAEDTDPTDIKPLSLPTYIPNLEMPKCYTYPSTSTSSNCQEMASNFLDVDFDLDLLIWNISQGKPFPRWFFANMTPIEVPSLPLHIDGTAYYKIPATDSTWKTVMKDLRHFTMTTTSHEGFSGEVCNGQCYGSFVCRNDRCPFVLTSNNRVPNRVSWRTPCGHRKVKICCICDETANREGSGAHKMIKFNDTMSTTLTDHLGNHKCGLQVDMQKRNFLMKSRIQERKLAGSAKEVSLVEIGHFIESGQMELAKSKADDWVDHRAVKCQMNIVNSSGTGDHNSFDAVGRLKRKTDESDKYYIYSIGNSHFSEDATTDHIFKSSKEMAELAIAMDQDSPDNILQLENAYFDTTHTRVYGFKTFGLWLQHPAMKMMIHLASMEIRLENYIHIAVFFRLFNKMVAEVKGEENYKFKQCYFV